MLTVTNIFVLFFLLPIIYYIGYLRACALRKDLSDSKKTIRIKTSHAYEHGLFLTLSVIIPTFLLTIIFHFYLQYNTDRLIDEIISLTTQQTNDNFEYYTLKQQINNYLQNNTPHTIENMNDSIENIKTKTFHLSIILHIIIFGVMVYLLHRGYRKITITFTSRKYLEQFLMVLMFLSATLAILTTLGIILSLIFETLQFFGKIPLTEFLFGTQWSPQLAIREDQVGSSGAFGIIPLLTGTLLITTIALFIAGPIGLLSAIYLTEFSSKRLRNYFKPLLEILAGIPTVVYGLFAVVTFAPFLRDLGYEFHFTVSSESAIVAGVTMGVMIIPFVSSLSDDIMHAVPQSLRDGSYALGSTKTENILKVVIPAALPGIAGAFLLAISRAIGETMIVVMAAGMAANLSINPLEAVTTITVQMTSLLVGDQEFDSAKTLAAFALGFTLFIITLLLNFIALRIVKRYRELYE